MPCQFNEAVEESEKKRIRKYKKSFKKINQERIINSK